MLVVAGPARAQGTMGIQVRSSGAFEPRGSGGVVSNVVEMNTEVPVLPGRWIEVGGVGRGSSSSSRSGGGGASRHSTNSGGGGTSISVRVIPVTVGDETATGPLSGATGTELLAALESEDASMRLAALGEVQRRPVTGRALLILSKKAILLLQDPSTDVAREAARAVVAMRDPSADDLLEELVRDPETGRRPLLLWCLRRLRSE